MAEAMHGLARGEILAAVSHASMAGRKGIHQRSLSRWVIVAEGGGGG